MFTQVTQLDLILTECVMRNTLMKLDSFNISMTKKTPVPPMQVGLTYMGNSRYLIQPVPWSPQYLH